MLANHKYIKPSLQVSAHDTYQHCVGQCTPGPRQRTPFTPRSNSSRQMTRASRAPQSISMSSAQDCNIIYTRLQYHLHKIAISFTQDCNIIYTRYQFHLHKISTSSTQNINVINIKNVIHARYQYQPHTTSMSSALNINVIHTRHQCHPHKV